MKYIIGIDGGGTKTEGIAYNLHGDELAREYSGFGNLLLGDERALENITYVIDGCIKKVKSQYTYAECIFICCGLAGIDSADNPRKVEEVLKYKYKTDIRVLNDADIALKAILRGEDGILTISGTGSISYGMYNDIKARAGGWGHLLGDEGSGYDIAIKAFKRIIEEKDLDLNPGELSRAVLKRLCIDDANDIKGFIYSSSKGEIASIAPIVNEMAGLGDDYAEKILCDAGHDLAVITGRVYKKLKYQGHLKVGIKGSILIKMDIVKKEFEKKLHEFINDFKIIDDDVSPALGGYYTAINVLNKKY